MKEIVKSGIKHQYAAPTIIKIGDISKKTLGSNRYELDNHTSSGDGCINNGHAHMGQYDCYTDPPVS